MGIFAEMQADGLTYYDILKQNGSLREYRNDLKQVLFTDETDTNYISLIKQAFHLKAILKVVKVNIKQQADLMYSQKARFICILNRNDETGQGYQEFFGKHEFEREHKKYIGQEEKMICFSSLYSKFPTSNGTIRTVENIERTSIFIQDLDAGKNGMPISEQLRRIAKLVKEDKIEMPHMLLFTGTGLQPVWFIDRLMMKINSRVHDTWVGIQQALFDIFQEAGLEPDDAVLNPAHNTRLVETLNVRANGARVRGYVLRTDRLQLGHFINKHFGQLHDVYKKTPKRKNENKENKKSVVKSPKFWNQHSFAWGMIQDMKNIVIWKAMHNESIVGLKWRWRMATIVRFNALIYYGGATDLALKEVENWWDTLTYEQREGTSLKEITRRSRTAEKYYNQWMKKELEEGSKYKRPGLFYKNKTLIDELQLSIECQVKLNVIKSRVERLEKDKDGNLKRVYNKEFERVRKTIERREKGVKERSEYLKEQSKTFLKVKELYEKGMKQKDIVTELNMSKSRVSELVKRLKEQS